MNDVSGHHLEGAAEKMMGLCYEEELRMMLRSLSANDSS